MDPRLFGVVVLVVVVFHAVCLFCVVALVVVVFHAVCLVGVWCECVLESGGLVGHRCENVSMIGYVCVCIRLL